MHTIDSPHEDIMPEVLSDQDRRRIVNEMQIRVARELFSKDSLNDNEIMFKWVDQSRGDSLSRMFRQIIESHPELVEQYADANHLHQYNQDSVIAKIEELLKENHFLPSVE